MFGVEELGDEVEHFVGEVEEDHCGTGRGGREVVGGGER